MIDDEPDPYQLLADRVREKELNDQIRKEYRQQNREKINLQQRQRYAKSHTYTIRCPHELADQISDAAEDLKISINTFILNAIRRSLTAIYQSDPQMISPDPQTGPFDHLQNQA